MTHTNGEQLVDVDVLEFPLPIYRESLEHNQELMREFALIAARPPEPGSGHEVPRRLMALMESLTVRYRGMNEAVDTRRDAALDAGKESIDLHYRVPSDVRQACLALARMLDEADDFCRSGSSLLTLATPPRAKAFRDWYLDEFVRQIDGAEPLPWSRFVEERGVPA